MWQVLHTLGFVFSARGTPSGEHRTFSMATMGEIEKRVGEPLPVEW